MKRVSIIGVLCLIVTLTLACNFPVATGAAKMTPVHIETTGDRRDYSGEYSCEHKNTVVLDIDADGVASLSTKGIFFMDYITCTPDSSNVEITYTINGLADPDTKAIVFTSCNDGGFTADGTVFYTDTTINGNVTCRHGISNEQGELAISLWMPSKN